MIATPFLDPGTAASKYLPPQIAHMLEGSAKSVSVLLADSGVGALVETATAYVSSIAILPVDPEADARVERFIASQAVPTQKAPIPRR